jgi:hypothetical protein
MCDVRMRSRVIGVEEASTAESDGAGEEGLPKRETGWEKAGKGLEYEDAGDDANAEEGVLGRT